MIIKNIFGWNPVNQCNSSLLVLQKNMAEHNSDLLPILVIILCIFLAVAIVGLIYCCNYHCVTKKKKNEASATSKVEKMENHGIEIIHEPKLPKANQTTYNEKKDGYMDPNCLKEFNTWLNPER